MNNPYSTDKYRPYVSAIGELTLTWNALHETLCLLFTTVMGGGPANQSLAVWHAIPNDRTQRKVLLAAVQSDLRGALPKQYLEDVAWLCKQIDNLEETRNNALHSPLTLFGPIKPSTSLGHVRAEKLAKRDLLSEFAWCRDTAIALSGFAFAIDEALADYTQTWPDKPMPVNRGAKKQHPEHPNREARVRQPPSSRR